MTLPLLQQCGACIYLIRWVFISDRPITQDEFNILWYWAVSHSVRWLYTCTLIILNIMGYWTTRLQANTVYFIRRVNVFTGHKYTCTCLYMWCIWFRCMPASLSCLLHCLPCYTAVSLTLLLWPHVLVVHVHVYSVWTSVWSWSKQLSMCFRFSVAISSVIVHVHVLYMSHTCTSMMCIHVRAHVHVVCDI